MMSIRDVNGLIDYKSASLCTSHYNWQLLWL